MVTGTGIPPAQDEEPMTSELAGKAERFDFERFEGAISQVKRKISQNGDTEAQHILRMTVKRLLPAIGHIKPLVTTIARLDPHHIAPYVCAGVFFALKVGKFPYLESSCRNSVCDLLTVKADFTRLCQHRDSVNNS
jgi:hypothetical protein